MPPASVSVLYIQEEDPRPLTRARLRALVNTRCGDDRPENLHVAVRRGVDLDDALWIERLIADLTRLEVRLLVLDAARRLSAKTDEGPTKVRELVAVLRRIIVTTGVSIVIAEASAPAVATGSRPANARPRSRGSARANR
jgi:AAA domain